MSTLTGSLTAQGLPSPQPQVPYTISTGTATTGGFGNYGTITIDPNLWGGYASMPVGSGWSTPGYNTVIIPTQVVYFTIGEDTKSKEDEATLMSHFLDILEDKIHFSPRTVGKKIEPMETIMKYIKSKKKFNIKLTRSGYEIEIKGVLLKCISNLLSKDSDTTLKIAFEYDELSYDNTLLSLEEKRAIKVNELMKNMKKNDI